MAGRPRTACRAGRNGVIGTGTAAKPQGLYETRTAFHFWRRRPTRTG